MSKEFKPYEKSNIKEDIEIKRISLGPLPSKEEGMDVEKVSGADQGIVTEKPPEVTLPPKDKEGIFIFKGFRSYN
jgi:hypothetical protein